MPLLNLLRWFVRRRSSLSLPKRVRCRLEVESLENRLTPAAATPSQNFVAQTYLDLLQHPVDPSGLTFWSGLLDKGVSPGQVALQIEKSTEFLQKEVDLVYKQFLGRPVEAAARDTDVALLQNGDRIEQVAAAVLGSTEYFAKHGGTNDGFLTGVFTELLHRSAVNQSGNAIDPVGTDARQGWNQVLNTGLSRYGVVSLIENGQEFQKLNVKDAYTNFLKRSADDEPGGEAFWTAAGQQFGGAQVLAGILGSHESFQLTQVSPVTPVPTVGNITPTSGPVGTSVTLTGAFLGGATVAFNGTNAPNVTVSADGKTITVPVPAGATTGPLTVTTPFSSLFGGPFSSPFTVTPGIASFTPNNGPALTTTVTIKGTNFVVGHTTVTFTGVNGPVTAANPTVSADGTTVTVKVPNGAATGPITLTTPDGSAATNNPAFHLSPTNFTVTPPGGATFTAFNPNNVTAGPTVTITGTNFVIGTTTVAFNGTPATINSISADGTTMTVAVPAGGSTGLISVTNPPNAPVFSPSLFFYLPTITSAPGSGAVGDSITIMGTNLNGTTVTVNGISATITNAPADGKSLTFTVPDTTSGSFTVSNPAGSQQRNFTVLPHITNISPTSGLAGSMVTITGTNLNGANLKVSFEGVTANIISSSRTQIVAQVPTNAIIGFSGPFTVNTQDGTSNPSANFRVSLNDTDADLGANGAERDNSIFDDFDGDGI
jgi:hypothetical protein